MLPLVKSSLRSLYCKPACLPCTTRRCRMDSASSMHGFCRPNVPLFPLWSSWQTTPAPDPFHSPARTHHVIRQADEVEQAPLLRAPRRRNGVGEVGLALFALLLRLRLGQEVYVAQLGGVGGALRLVLVMLLVELRQALLQLVQVVPAKGRGGWGLEVGSWSLAVGGWRLEVGGCVVACPAACPACTPPRPQPAPTFQPPLRCPALPPPHPNPNPPPPTPHTLKHTQRDMPLTCTPAAPC